MKTDCSLDSIWVRKLHIRQQGEVILQLHMVDVICKWKTVWSHKERIENLMHYKLDFIHPSSSHHIGYTPFIAVTAGGAKRRNKRLNICFHAMYIYRLKARRECCVWVIFFKPQCIKAADVELFNKLQFVLYTLWRTKPVIHIPFIVAVLII